MSIEPTPFHEGLWAFRSEAGLLAPGPTPPRLPGPPEADRWLRAVLTRCGEHPRSQWRVRAGFPPASLHHRPLNVWILLDTAWRMLPRGPTLEAARSAPDVLQIGVPIAESTSLGLIQRLASGEKASRLVEIIGATDREGALHHPVLQIPVGERPVLKGSEQDLLIPVIGRTHVLEFTPVGEDGIEVGDLLVGNVPAEHVQGSRLPVVERDIPMLDPHRRATVHDRVVFADVARGVHPGDRGLKARGAAHAPALTDL